MSEMLQERPAMPPLAALAGQRPIEDYGFIGDMRGAALVARDGSVDWLCLQRFDAVPLLFSLLDRGQGGACTVTLADADVVFSRRYLPGTNILETTLQGRSSAITVTDFMPLRLLENAGDFGPDTQAPGCLVRIVRNHGGKAEVSLDVSPRFDWARSQTRVQAQHQSVDFVDEDVRIACSHALLESGPTLPATWRACATLETGACMALIIGPRTAFESDITATAEQLQEQTGAYWTGWSTQHSYQGRFADQVLRSALCMKLLIYAPTGALIAAPTTGLPEAVGGVRNWDYRYVWTRDASFCVSAFLNLGLRREAAEFLRFLHQANHEGDVVRVMYSVDGQLCPEQTLDHLAGWRDSRPVLTGNLAEDQQQHEIFGELLAALNLYVSQHGLEGLCPALRENMPQALEQLADAAIARWNTPDQGIWELRGPARHLLHTKGMCWVALDRAITLSHALGFDLPPHWKEERDIIRATCLERAWNEERGVLAMEFGGSELDMSTLRLAMMGFIDVDDPRMRATFDATLAELCANPSAQGKGDGDLFYRYRFDDGLPGQEGAFVACSFWVAGLLTLQGRHEAAQQLLGSVLSRGNDLGLFAEEFDPVSGAQLGNFPQGFTHMAIIHEVVRLHEALAKNSEP